MSFCEICGRDLSTSNYHLPAEIREKNNKIKFVHVECCSDDDIRKNLLLYAQNQVTFYHDIIDLLKNTTPDKILEHEKKYGTYEEVSQGVQLDHELMLSALISELKGKVEQH